MNKNLAAEVKKQAKVADCLEKYKALVDKYPRLKLEKEVYDAKRLRLAVLMAKKGEVTTGITVDKIGAFDNYGNLLYKTCLKATVWATDTNNQTLAAIFNVTLAGFAKQTYAQKLEQGKGIYDALSSCAAELTAVGVKDTDLVAIADARTVCDAAYIALSKAATDKKTANEGAELAMADIDKSITIMANLIISEYSDTEPDFVSSYQNNCKVETIAARHTGISATITDAATSKAIENATLTIADLNKTATSNMAGLAEIIKMKAGSYHVSIAAEGYATQWIDVTVGKSRVVDLVVGLVLG